jgi:hypothetical protein
MSIIVPKTDELGNLLSAEPFLPDTKELLEGKHEISEYKPTPEEQEMRMLIIKHFGLGYQTMYYPRVEFNDMSVIQRMQIDQMSFNTYQSNNGQPGMMDSLQSWRSRAMRPIVRNKCISIAAHATARLIFPKIKAVDPSNNEQQDASMVMSDLMEWVADKTNYGYYSLQRVISALTDPASIGYIEYANVVRSVKRGEKKNGKYELENIVDESMSGLQSIPVPADQLYIENFYEPDIQKQGWLIWRRVMSYSQAYAKYHNKYPNFKYVREGVQVVYNDANAQFYNVYDPGMRQWDVEEIVYWNKNLDVKIIMVNGVMLTEYDNPNPRQDKMYPFDKFFYELINTKCFYGMSLAFKMQQDANIINTLYPMIIDGTYLNIMPPMTNVGGETVSSDVIVPGAVTTFENPNSNLTPITTSNNLKSGIDALNVVEESINQSSQDPIQQGQDTSRSGTTAYEISRLEQNAATVLGLFIKMIAQFVLNYGRLCVNDILQYMTLAEAAEIDNPKLVYKTFLLHDRQTEGKAKTRKIVFDNTLPDEVTDEDKKNIEMGIVEEQGGIDSDQSLAKVNPTLFRNLKFHLMVTPDVLNPRSSDLERAFDLETYDRAIANPLANQEEIFKTLLLSTNPKTKKDPDRFVAQQQSANSQDPMAMMGKMPQAGNSPLANMGGKTPLPQTMPTGNLSNV